MGGYLSARDARDGRSAVGEAEWDSPGGGWRLYEDRAGKPGWVSTGGPGASIRFRLRMGGAPRIQLTYVRGYTDEWGEVRLTMNVSDGGSHAEHRGQSRAS